MSEYNLTASKLGQFHTIMSQATRNTVMPEMGFNMKVSLEDTGRNLDNNRQEHAM